VDCAACHPDIIQNWKAAKNHQEENLMTDFSWFINWILSNKQLKK